MTVLATLLDGRTIAEGDFGWVFIDAGSVGVLSVAIPELKVVEKALGIHLSTNTAQTVSPHSIPFMSGNTVGLSVYVGAYETGGVSGISVAGQVTVIGF